MKYHCEYEVRICNLNWGSLLLGRFRTYAEAIASVTHEKMGVFNIKKVRVYE